MTAIDFLVEKLKLESIDLSLYHQNLINKAKEMERDQLIMFGTQCMVEVEKDSGLGSIRIYELFFDKKFNKL
jgi:hypothetical protein